MKLGRKVSCGDSRPRLSAAHSAAQQCNRTKRKRDVASNVSLKAETQTTLRRRRRRSRWRRGNYGSRRRRHIVHQILQFLARLEERNLLRWHFHPLPGLRVEPDPRLALPRPETAKAANLDLVAGAQRAHHAVKNRLHDHFTVFPRKFRQTRDFVNQIGFGHNPSSFRLAYVARTKSRRPTTHNLL